jgi:all-trans-retinol dehydrogenase (NAD+)
VRELKGKLVLVTGGAGGLGLATARAFAREGARLALWDLDLGRVEAAASALRAEGIPAQGFAVDVSDPAAVRSAAAVLEAELGPVDVLDNNAGVHARGGLLDADDAACRRQVAVNLESYIWCARAFVPGMRARGSGHLVWIASAAGLLGVPGMAVYSATKHGVIGLAESLRLELRRDGVTGVGTTIVCPSFIDTGMFPGTTPPRLAPWLKPEALAERIVAAVKAERRYVREPALVKLIPLLRVLPGAAQDFLCSLTGMDRSLTGR